MIDSFRGDYAFLSSFWEVIIKFDKRYYCSVEHAYQASKTLDSDQRDKITMSISPAIAKRIGRTFKIRENWDEIKFRIMKDLVFQKFELPTLRKRLLDTGSEALIEGNTWGDTYWGVYKGLGKNYLGKILMEKRSLIIIEEAEIKNERKK